MQRQRVYQAIFHLTDPLPCDTVNRMLKKEISVVKSSVDGRLLAQAEVAKLVYKPSEDTLVVGHVVIHRSENGLFNINDLHSASGAGSAKRPPNYMRTAEAKRVIARLEAKHGPGVHETVVGGVAPGTYVHKHLAYAYATWLDDEYMLLALEILDEVTNRMVDGVQTAFQALADKYGEAVALQYKTVEELGNAYQTLNREKFYNSELINVHRGDKRLNKNSPVVQELGLARRNVRLMVNSIRDNQNVLTNVFDALESIKYGLEQEMRVQPMNNYYTKLVNTKVLEPIKGELVDLKEQLRLNVKLMNDAEQYMANASNIVSDEASDDES